MIISIGLGLGIIYTIGIIYGKDYAWMAFFIIFFNVYLYYRLSIRQVVKKRYPTSVDSYLKEQGVEIEHEEEYANYIVRMDRKYKICRNCTSQIIPELDYCEECGTAFSE